MRITRSQGKRMLKKASKHQTGYGEGLWCSICNPRPWGKMNKQTARNRADYRQMQGLE